MQRSQIIAILLTAAIFLGITAFFVDIPEVDFDNIKLFSKEAPSHKGKEIIRAKTKRSNSKSKTAGSVIDSYKGVKVYDNGSVRSVYGRNTTSDGYNLGLKYQCVEFVKRFYYEYFNHKMPNSYGNAKDFYKPGLGDGSLNADRGLIQFKNGSGHKPKEKDILVYGGSPRNSFGHVAIISDVGSRSIEIIQQNPGKGNESRINLGLTLKNGLWYVNESYILGWLRMK